MMTTKSDAAGAERPSWPERVNCWIVSFLAGLGLQYIHDGSGTSVLPGAMRFPIALGIYALMACFLAIQLPDRIRIIPRVRPNQG
jgi:hypothetical protein